MNLIDLMRRRSPKRRATVRPTDPFAGFTTRDWADLPPFHPPADFDWRPR